MIRTRPRGLYAQVAVRAVEDELYERFFEAHWDELKHVFEDPEIQQAEAKIMHAIAEAFAPGKYRKSRRRRNT